MKRTENIFHHDANTRILHAFEMQIRMNEQKCDDVLDKLSLIKSLMFS